MQRSLGRRLMRSFDALVCALLLERLTRLLGHSLPRRLVSHCCPAHFGGLVGPDPSTLRSVHAGGRAIEWFWDGGGENRCWFLNTAGCIQPPPHAELTATVSARRCFHATPQPRPCSKARLTVRTATIVGSPTAQWLPVNNCSLYFVQRIFHS